MSMWGWIFGAACLLLAFGMVYNSRRKVRKTMETLNKMLEQAINGNYTETSFDESMLSALETRFAQYLSASAASAENVSAEKERIKELIGDISHQTKTPIANLLLYTELLQEEVLSPEAGVYVNTLHAQSEKLQFLIDALVKLSRLENGIIALQPEVQAVTPLLYQVQKQFEVRAAEKGLELVIKPMGVSACFDFKWTAEALCNLVDNAIKYTEQGSIVLSVTPYELFVRVDVKDTGVGIPESQQAQIFSRFYRGEGHEKQEGVGIGLYLTREILQKEGGYIKVSSQIGKGSIFSMFLPV